jgi:hypothetical protein
VLLQEISLPKFQGANLSLFLLLVFYQQQDSQNGAALTSLTAANLTGTICGLGNSFYWYYSSCFK